MSLFENEMLSILLYEWFTQSGGHKQIEFVQTRFLCQRFQTVVHLCLLCDVMAKGKTTCLNLLFSLLSSKVGLIPCHLRVVMIRMLFYSLGFRVF